MGQTQLQLRRDTGTNWASENPILAEGEIGIVMDSIPKKIKIGDGVTVWNSLLYFAITVEGDPVFLASEAASFVSGDKSKLDGIEVGATKYPDTGEEVYSSAEKTKLTGIESGADVTDIANVGSALHGAVWGEISGNSEMFFWETTDATIEKMSWSNIEIQLQNDLGGFFAPLSKGVTNGDSHDHISGDGATITEGALSLTDITTGNASVTAHGFAPKAVAPTGENDLNVLGIVYGNSNFTNIPMFDSTNPSAIGTAAPGIEQHAARRDHVHAADHVNLANKGTNTHAQIDTFIGTTAPETYAPIAKGVTNGDSHDHNGGDGAQIAYGNLSATSPSWTAPTLTNSWVDYGSGLSTTGYYKDKNNIVHLRGVVKSGTVGQPIFTLPVGFRPAFTLIVPCVSNGVLGVASVGADGTVNPSSGSNVYFSIDGIQFEA